MSNEITVKITVTATIRKASQSECERYGQPLGTLEVLEGPDGDRMAWAHSRREAIDTAAGLVGSDMDATVAVSGDIDDDDDRWNVTYHDGSRWVTVMSRDQFWVKRVFTKVDAGRFIELYGRNFFGKMKAIRSK